MPDSGLRGLPWAAGKGAGAPSGVGRWVASCLAEVGRDMYAECYGGQIGVLLQRKRAGIEIVSDADRRVFDWWLAVRDHGDELRARLDATPCYSRLHLEEAKTTLADADSGLVERAAALAVLAFTAWHQTTFRYTGNATRWPDIGLLADRLRLVGLWHCPATEMLDRLASRSIANQPDALVYADPPYPGTTDPYSGTFTAADAAENETQLLALAERGWHVAVSCAPGSFPKLEAA